MHDVIAHRLFDERAERLGPYYVEFRSIDAHASDPISIFELGLEEHNRWKRYGDEAARDSFIAKADWAAGAQRTIVGVCGSYAFPTECKDYACRSGFRSATAQSEAISLLLRAYEETESEHYIERAKDAAIPLMVDVRDGGVMWEEGEDVFFEDKAGVVPSHVLSGWICALWGLLELSRVTNMRHPEQLYRRSLRTLEKYLPCYDSGSWSYESLLAAPSGFRRFSKMRRHLLHVAQLNVLLSMTKNDLFAVVSERWRNYVVSTKSRIRLFANTAAALPNSLLSHGLTIPGGARVVV